MYFIVVDGYFIILGKPSRTEELREVVKMVSLLPTEWNKSIEFTQNPSPSSNPLKEKKVQL